MKLSSLCSVVLGLCVAGASFLPHAIGANSGILGAVCVPGPSPCRATNSVLCLGQGCQVGNWDECLIAYEASPFNCFGPGGPNDHGGAPTHCTDPACTLTCSEMCLDGNGNPAGDINNM